MRQNAPLLASSGFPSSLELRIRLKCANAKPAIGTMKLATVIVEYDEEAGLTVVRPPLRERRKSWNFGRRLTVEEIEADIERGQYN